MPPKSAVRSGCGSDLGATGAGWGGGPEGSRARRRGRQGRRRHSPDFDAARPLRPGQPNAEGEGPAVWLGPCSGARTAPPIGRVRHTATPLRDGSGHSRSLGPRVRLTPPAKLRGLGLPPGDHVGFHVVGSTGTGRRLLHCALRDALVLGELIAGPQTSVCPGTQTPPRRAPQPCSTRNRSRAGLGFPEPLAAPGRG